jgi:hypothetical protein
MVKRLGQRITCPSVNHLIEGFGLISTACAVLDSRKCLILAVTSPDSSYEAMKLAMNYQIQGFQSGNYG